LVEDALIGGARLAQWSDALSRKAAAAERLLCREWQRVEKSPVCGVSFTGAVSVTPSDRPVEDELRRIAPPKTASGVVDEDGLNFLFEQESPSERRVFVVRRLLYCAGEGGVGLVACTRIRGRVTVTAFGDAITLLHELGHQVGLSDRPDPGSLMYRGRPVPRVGTAISAAEIARFRLLLSPP
jgi:hypothetical protein